MARRFFHRACAVERLRRRERYGRQLRAQTGLNLCSLDLVLRLFRLVQYWKGVYKIKGGIVARRRKDYRVCELGTFATAVEAAISSLAEEWGGIDVLINNAGLGGTANLVDMTDDQWNAVLDVTLNGTMRCTRAALRPSAARAPWGPHKAP